jgi:hypothetical protein
MNTLINLLTILGAKPTLYWSYERY